MIELGDIDLVYTWCDAADDAFRSKRNALAERLGVPLTGGTNGSCRYCSNDELRYSMRSVDMYMPWVRRVFLVIDDDITPPSWLNQDCDALRIVRLGEIMAPENLPCFNSTSIEFHLPNIPGLAERFLYSNDDMFACAPIAPSFFFADDGYPYFRYRASKIDLDGDPPQDNYLFRVWKSFRFIRSEFGSVGDFAKACGWLSHHNIDAYCKSDMLEFRNRYRELVEETVKYPFRSAEQYHREIFNGFALARGHGHFRMIKRPWYEVLFGAPHRDSYYFSPGRQTLTRDLKRINPKLFCMNDNADVSDEDRKTGRAFLEQTFAVKSRFER